MNKIIIGITIGIICTISIFLFLGDIDIQAEIQIGEKTNEVKTQIIEVKAQIKRIAQASIIYKMETDSYPPDCWETLKEEDYLEIKKPITRKWEFECSFDEDGDGGTVTATSTEEMGGGAGKIIRYDKETGRYSGYGCP